MWSVIPMRGENFSRNKVTMGRKEWSLSAYDRAPETTRTEQGTVCWSMGVLKVALNTDEVGESDSKTISTLTTTVSNAFMGMMTNEEGKMVEGRSEDVGRWKEKKNPLVNLLCENFKFLNFCHMKNNTPRVTRSKHNDEVSKDVEDSISSPTHVEDSIYSGLSAILVYLS